MRPSQTILVLEDLRKSFAGPLHRKGIELSFNDSQTVIDVYQQWLLLMMDLGYLHPESLERTARRLLTDMVKADVLSLNNAFSELLNHIRVQANKGFKALCSMISPHLYPLIKNDYELVVIGDVYAAQRLIQLFSYTSRLTLRDIDLTQQCLDAYVDVEANIATTFPKHLIFSLQLIIERWMESFDPNLIHFQHGPGGVAGHGRTSYQVKYKDLTFDERLTYVFGDPWWSAEGIRSSLDRISETIFVPKSYKTFRTISMESSTLMYTQQGVWNEIDRVVSSSRYLRNRIGFHEQERNQRKAKEGSIRRNYATIDLSSASDSVSYALVKKLFRNTKVLPYLVATRSDRTLLPDGRVLKLKKFAPMGSALCFPIETLIFASICDFVTRDHGVNGDYSVFGDDIIVPTQCVADTMLILETLGFSVNDDKSFYRSDCWFRESCGTEYCDGFDVTPMRVSRKYNHTSQLVNTIGLIDMSNTAYTKGYRNLRAFFVRKLRISGFTPLFGSNEMLGDNYSNYHTERRWNFDLQRIECRVSTLVPKTKDDQDDVIRLRHWFESTHNRSKVMDGFASSISRVTVEIKDRWRVKPYEDLDQSFIDFFTQ